MQATVLSASSSCIVFIKNSQFESNRQNLVFFQVAKGQLHQNMEKEPDFRLNINLIIIASSGEIEASYTIAR